MKEEIYKDIQGWEGHYQVSNLGNVKSLDKKVVSRSRWGGKIIKTYIGKILKKNIGTPKYFFVTLSCPEKIEQKLIHILVASTFIKNKHKKEEVNHIDGNKLNNFVDNLEWVTAKENMKHSYKIGTSYQLYKNCEAGEYPYGKKVINTESGKIYPSLRYVSEIFNYKYSTLANMLNGHRVNKTSFKYI